MTKSSVIIYLFFGSFLFFVVLSSALAFNSNQQGHHQGHRIKNVDRYSKLRMDQYTQRWREGLKYDPGHDWVEADPVDYIIVGAGSAGSVLANRLSAEENKFSVLVIEAGPPDATLNRAIEDPFEMGNVFYFLFFIIYLYLFTYFYLFYLFLSFYFYLVVAYCCGLGLLDSQPKWINRPAG